MIITNVGKYTVHASYGAAEVPFLGGVIIPHEIHELAHMSYGQNYLLGKLPSPNEGGPLSVMKVPWDASKFKAASYSVHPLSTSSWLSDVEQLKGVRLAEPATKFQPVRTIWDVLRYNHDSDI